MMIRMESTKQKADARAEQDHLRAALAHGRDQAQAGASGQAQAQHRLGLHLRRGP